jgi:hypothetical protein
MRLKTRLAALEEQMAPSGLCIFLWQRPGQTDEETFAEYEAEYGPIGDKDIHLLKWQPIQEAPCN